MTTLADRHQQHEEQRGRRPGRAQHLRPTMFPLRAATIAGCTVRSLRRRTWPRTWPACGRAWRSGGAILPDGCADVVWRGAGLVVAGPGDRRRSRPRARRRRRCSACASGSARRAPALGLPADGAGRPDACPLADVWGAGVEERVAAGGLPALLAGRARAARRRARRPARPRRRARPGASRARAWPRSATAGHQRAPAAPPLRRRRRLRPEDARPRAALPAVPGAGAPPRGDLAGLAFAAGYADQAHLTRECRRLVRPHARGARRRRRRRRRRASASVSFKPRRRRGAVPSGMMIDSNAPRATSGTTARVLEQRRFEVPLQGRPTAPRCDAALELPHGRRRLRLRAGARRARADEPAAAHLDGAGDARGRRRLDRTAARSATTCRR